MKRTLLRPPLLTRLHEFWFGVSAQVKDEWLAKYEQDTIVREREDWTLGDPYSYEYATEVARHIRLGIVPKATLLDSRLSYLRRSA